MKKTKAVFFDIDGTIWDSRNFIPESTIKAIHQLRSNGHYTFLCSGRTRGYIHNPQLLEIGFDGIVSGCGTMIEYRNQVVYYKEIERELAEFTVKTVREHGFSAILEGRNYIYMDDDEFKNDFFAKKLKSELGDHLRTIKDHWGTWEISKLSCATVDADTENCFKILSPYYNYMIHNSSVVEIIPKGHHKGTAIVKVCDLLDMDLADTVAFGDSANDIGMFYTADIGVAMGNGSDVAKEAADYITTPLLEDGVWNACKHLELI